MYLPVYYCPSTTEALVRTGLRIRYYHVGENLLPEAIPDHDGTAVLLVDYFGVLDDEIKAFAMSFQRASVLLDLAHAFFCPPLLRKNVYNVYSARKYFGVPDGAYLICEAPLGEAEPGIAAGTNAHYLLKAYEEGTNAAYVDKKWVDDQIAAVYAPMSILARGLLCATSYESVRRKRLCNYACYDAALGGQNQLRLASPFPAYVYPFLCPDGKELKQTLIEARIWVPTLWKSEQLIRIGNAFERDMSEKALFLPLDQRYDSRDIEYLTGFVEELLC